MYPDTNIAAYVSAYGSICRVCIVLHTIHFRAVVGWAIFDHKESGKDVYELQSCGKGPVTTIPRVSHVHIKVYKSLSCSPSKNFNHHQPPMNHLQLLQILHIQYCTPIQTRTCFIYNTSNIISL